MHDRDVVGVDTPPSGEAVEIGHQRPRWGEERPADARVVQDGMEPLEVLERHGLDRRGDEPAAEELGPAVDIGRDAARDEIAAETVVVENAAGDAGLPRRRQGRLGNPARRRLRIMAEGDGEPGDADPSDGRENQ